MIRKLSLVLGLFLFAATAIVLAQDATTQATPVAPETQMPTAPTDADMQWLWGEAVSVDNQKNEVLVKYQDYDVEQEKEMTIGIDDKTTFENVKSLSEIQPKDTLSIDYKVVAEGKNIAKNISVEKGESPEAVSDASGIEPVAVEPASTTTETVVPSEVVSPETKTQTDSATPAVTPAQ